MTIMGGVWKQTDRHDVGTVAQSLPLIHKQEVEKERANLEWHRLLRQGFSV